MGIKKIPGRFTIQFNLNDPQQKVAADILEQQGRKKAQMIANALSVYIDNAKGLQNRSMPIDGEQLECAIMAVLAKHTCCQQQTTNSPLLIVNEPPPQQQTESSLPPNRNDLISQENMIAIHNTLSAFQHL